MSSLIKKAPSTYDGTLGELYDGWAKDVLLAAADVEEFHKQFCAYLDSADPLFLVRMVKGQVRGQLVRTENGEQLCPTDNSPAWWIHDQIFSGQFRRYSSFADFVRAIPSHMFLVQRSENINKAGWHVAHIFDVKDRNLQFQKWDHNELVRRTARNIHPCNYFYIPKYEWRRYGGNPTVIAFFYDKFRSRYQSIWEDFLRLVDGTPLILPQGASEYRYTLSMNQKLRHNVVRIRGRTSDGSHGCVVQYSSSRLCFKADVIEPLEMDDKFCIVTKVGTFTMTKREFYRAFPNVPASRSYREHKNYNYAALPKKALQFKVIPGDTV